LQAEIVINFIVVLISFYLLQKKSTNQEYRTDVKLLENNYSLITIPACSIFFFENSMYYLIVLCSLFFVDNSKIRKSENIHFLKKMNSIIKRLILIWPLLLLVSFFTNQFFNEFREQDLVSKVRELRISYELLNIVVLAVIISPVLEEIFFRRLMYRSLKKNFGVLLAGTITSFLFAVVHLNLYAFPVLFVLSIILIVIYEKDNTIFSPMLLHSIFNLVMIISILFLS
jgi:membrane protease YdiL (CAAX protease family)